MTQYRGFSKPLIPGPFTSFVPRKVFYDQARLFTYQNVPLPWHWLWKEILQRCSDTLRNRVVRFGMYSFTFSKKDVKWYFRIQFFPLPLFVL